MHTLEHYMAQAHTLEQREAIAKANLAIKALPEPHQTKVRESMLAVLDTQTWDNYSKDISTQQEKAEHALAEISEITGVHIKLEMPEEHFKEAMHEALTKVFKYGSPSDVASVLMHHACFNRAKALCEVYRSI
jgi:hypothetical protein